MSKEKKRTRGSIIADSSDLEQENISAEFTDFVRSAFDKMGVKMDNIITGQQALEVKLDLVNQQVQSNKGDTDLCTPVFFRICYGIQPRIRKYGFINLVTESLIS